jgi:SAM-dependent methyltransferase
MQTVAPYEELAEIYDTVMSHIGYDIWMDFIRELCDAHEVAPDTTLDLSCGTGKTLPYMKDRFGTIYCTDLSIAMIKILVENYPEYRNSTFISDMGRIPVNTKFDLILNIQDSLNYYTEPDALQAHLIDVERCLQDGGAYIFDFSTEENIKNNFQNMHELYEDEDYGYERLNTYLPNKRLNITEFYIWKRNNGKQQQFHEKHIQKMYSLEQIEEVLLLSPFSRWQFYEDELLQPASDESERIHVIALKGKE